MTAYPQYRKYPNEKAYFKITSETTFEELTIIGSNYGLINFEAKNFLDIHLISDMVNLMGNNWVMIEESEFERQLRFCRDNYKLIPSL